MVVGYKLIDTNGSEIQSWGGTWGVVVSVPNPLKLPNGDYVHAPLVGVDYGGYTLIEWEMEILPEIVARQLIHAQDMAEVEAVKADSFVQSFVAMTPAQVSAYVENNTANLAQVRSLLTKMALMLLALARKEYR
jgi:hypothetical protein